MTVLDVASVALVVIIAFVEAKRSAPTAAVDLVLAFLGLSLAKQLTTSRVFATMPDQTAFCIWFGLFVLGGALAGYFFDNHTKWDIGPYDSTIAAVLGAVTGLVVAHGVFHVSAIAGSAGEAMLAKSLLGGEIYHLNTIKAILSVLQNLGGGPRIGDEVRDQMQ